MKRIRIWRICHENYNDTAFSGEGARLFGGRFNSEGNTAVYTSGSLSLALLEMLVRTNDRSYFEKCIVFHTEIKVSDIFETDAGKLPEGWDKNPYEKSSQEFGDQWLISKKKLVLKVPSVVVPVEHNYILNPLHPDFQHLSISKPERLTYDSRLLETKKSK